MELFIFLTVFVLLAFYVAHGLRFVYTTRWLRALLAPGILACNAARLLACQATFTPRTETNLWERDGVKYEKTPIPWFGQSVIATATFALPFLLLFGLNHIMMYPLLVHPRTLPLQELNRAFDGFSSFVKFLLDLDDRAFEVFGSFADAVQSAGAANPAPWVMLYLSITVMLAAAPTKRDLRYLLFGLLVMVVLNRLFGIMGDDGGEMLSNAWFEAHTDLHNVWLLGTFLVSVLFGLFMIVACIDVVRKVRELAMEPDVHETMTGPSSHSSSRSRART